MKLVVGLGNPGPRYARTRHNAGFRVAECFAARHAIALDAERFGGLFGRGRVAFPGVESLDVGVLEPQGFMNRSGDAVALALSKLPVEDPSRDLIVALDDVDLGFGRLRLRAGGGAAGQKGLAHLIERLGRERSPAPALRDRPPPDTDRRHRLGAGALLARAGAGPPRTGRHGRRRDRRLAPRGPRGGDEPLQPGSGSV